MPSLASAGSVSSLLASLRALAIRFFTLMTVEGKQAGGRLLLMLVLALLAAGLAFTGWLVLLAGIVLALVQNNILSWGVALGVAALLSFAGAGGLALMVRRSPKPLFAATRRQFGPRRNLDVVANNGSPLLLLYEQGVEEARMAAYAEYQVVRKSFRHRQGSPLVIGGGMLAGIAVWCLVRGRPQPKDQLGPGRPSAWTQILSSVQMLTPLWLALRFATRRQTVAAPTSVLQGNGGGEATVRERHGS